MSVFFKQAFIILVLVLLGSGGLLAAKFFSMNNQPCIVKLMLREFSFDESYCYLFINSMDRCDGNYNTAKDLFSRTYVVNKIEDVNLSV